jgi:hypothetical protein
MPDAVDVALDLICAEEQALESGQEDLAASLAAQRLALWEHHKDSWSEGELRKLVLAQDRVQSLASRIREEVAAQLLQVRRQVQRARGYRSGAGFVDASGLALRRQG